MFIFNAFKYIARFLSSKVIYTLIYSHPLQSVEQLGRWDVPRVLDIEDDSAWLRTSAVWEPYSDYIEISSPRIGTDYYLFTFYSIKVRIKLRVKLIECCMRPRKTDKWSVRFLLQLSNPRAAIKECCTVAER